MVIFLINGFSDNMKKDISMKEITKPLSCEEFREILLNSRYVSAIGHKDLAEKLTEIFGIKIPYNRKNVRVGPDDLILRVHLSNRLPEHANTVQYKDKLNFSLKRFENQTSEDLAKSEEILKEILTEA